jgi:hypothetical protein
MRDEFNEKVKRVLQDRAGNRCSNPECRLLTSGPNAHPERSTKTGVAAHVSAASLGGPRYNPHLTSEQRRSAENGVWLCQNCAHFVDTDYLNYSVKILNDWKAEAEQDADDETKGRKGQLPPPAPIGPQEEQIEGWGCPFCGTLVAFDKSICLGCQAEVVPGLTRDEREESAKTGMMFGGGVAMLLLVVIPSWLKSSYGWNVEMFWGLGLFVIVVAAPIVFAGLYFAIHLSERKRFHEPPRFFRHMIK